MPTPPEPDELAPLLDRWSVPVPPPHLATRVLATVRAEPAAPRWRSRQILPRLAGITLALLLGSFGGIWWEQSRQADSTRARSAWLLAIDPVERTRLGAAENPGESPLARLDWLRRELDLSPAQFRQLGELHERFAPEFDALYRQLADLQHSYQDFDQQRRQDQAIDFIALYELLQSRELARASAEAASRRFLAALFPLLHPAQRAIIRGLLEQSAPHLATIAPPAPRHA